jgi:Rrf2 family transcriptional regulator, iron-sulfur cluster assembly transcription factor
MKLTTQSRYGVRAIFDIAYHSEGLDTQVRDISRRQGISARYIEQIFQKLKKGKIINSKRGPKGGYFLAKKPEEITVGEIIQITERGLDPVFCVNDHSKKTCERKNECVTRMIWSEAGRRLKDYFDSVTIKDLCGMAKKIGIEREIDQKYMYHI